MDRIYKQLAQVLDRIPNGYPETESGVELKILAKLFTPEEAELVRGDRLKAPLLDFFFQLCYIIGDRVRIKPV